MAEKSKGVLINRNNISHNLKNRNNKKEDVMFDIYLDGEYRIFTLTFPVSVEKFLDEDCKIFFSFC